jgi:hypothetical protein
MAAIENFMLIANKKVIIHKMKGERKRKEKRDGCLYFI